jgi:hypothetical protein
MAVARFDDLAMRLVEAGHRRNQKRLGEYLAFYKFYDRW